VDSAVAEATDTVDNAIVIAGSVADSADIAVPSKVLVPVERTSDAVVLAVAARVVDEAEVVFLRVETNASVVVVYAADEVVASTVVVLSPRPKVLNAAELAVAAPWPRP
jgi:hypothetical protein